MTLYELFKHFDAKRCYLILTFYKLNTITITIPPTNKHKPKTDFFENFSFKIIAENSIVNKIDNLPIELTAIGLTPSVFKA